MILPFLSSVILVSIPVQAQDEVTISALYYYDPPGYVGGVAAGGMVMVNLYIDSPSAWYDTEYGIVQWAVSVQVDPAVLEPIGAMGAKSGYFLYDFVAYYDPWGMTYSVSLMPPVVDKEAGTITWISEGIMGTPPIPHGAGGSGKLVTLGFKSLSETDYSAIDLFYDENFDAYYWTPESGETGIGVDIVEDGHYNAPTPEFPLGAAVEVGLIVAVAYIWWTRRRKLQGMS